ncbi:MAG: sugar ABC transporter permease [Vallitaleaceae bacterium]|jgi:putative multiple sugar transport system permease protein|nr:sugar ABC transporter permease [Vallitaleaceae bacterium]
MGKTSSIIRGNLRQYVMIIALVSVIILFQISTEGVLLMPLNIANIISQNSYIFILAVGMLLAILTNGNIDLSVGSVCAVVGAISAVMVVKMDLPVFLGIGVGLGIGIIIGMWHGFWIAYAGVPAFIVTLAGMLIFRGLTMVILQGTSLAPMPDSYKFIASGFIAPDLQVAGLNLIAMIAGVVASILYVISQMVSRGNKRKYGFDVQSYKSLIPQMAGMIIIVNAFTYALASYKGIPMVLVLVIALVAIYTFITTKTIPGRHIYAYGGNTVAARLSGVNTKKVLFWVYVNMGLLSAVAGIVFTGRLNSATPKAGVGFELDAIAACFIGGASTTGGIGTVIGAIVGALLMGVLNNGMSIMGVSIDWQQTIKGLVLLAAVAFDVYSKSKTK